MALYASEAKAESDFFKAPPLMISGFYIWFF
jgi:hypothetical protein